jgi:chromosomal replication initiation ATPase DnaA
VIAPTPAPVIEEEPVVIPHEFKVRKRLEYTQRQIRHELTAKAAAIHRGTGTINVDLADIERTPQEIIKAVADEFGVTASDIRGECRARFLVAVRFRAIARIYLAKPNASLPQIAKWFGRDHTSILHAVQKTGVHKNRLDRYRGIPRSMTAAL